MKYKENIKNDYSLPVYQIPSDFMNKEKNCNATRHQIPKQERKEKKKNKTNYNSSPLRSLLEKIIHFRIIFLQLKTF